MPFDIRGLHINFFDVLEIPVLTKILQEALKNQKWHKSRRVRVAAESIDERGLELLYNVGYRPEGMNHFHSKNLDATQKLSVLRLLDLGIIWFASECYPDRKGYEGAYRWTSFGYAVMEHLGIQRIGVEEFKKTQDYKDFMIHSKEFQKNKKHILEE